MCRLSKAEDCYSLIKTPVGTPGYTAPETLAGQFTAGHFSPQPYNRQADVWSAGVLLYLMLFGVHPFAGRSTRNSAEAVSAAIQAGHFTFPPDGCASQPARNLICAMLRRDPKQRLSIAGIMQHAWFVQGLPKGADSYNSRLLQEAACKPPLYTEDQLTELITEARLGI